MNLSALQPLLQAVHGARVACVGDLMVDRYVYGDVARISPEAPIPVLRKTSAQTMLGGMGNVARNVAGLQPVDLVAPFADATPIDLIKAILVTRGAKGMSLAERGKPVLHVRGVPRRVFDVSGAGDTGLAALRHAWITAGVTAPLA